MGKDSGIEWTDHTHNPWWGCTKVSEGCANCYAEKWSKRTGNNIWGPNAPRRFFGDKHWSEPLKWNRASFNNLKTGGRRLRVFCASMADVFEDREDLVIHRQRLFNLIADTPFLDWLVLTKRPENIRRMYPNGWLLDPPGNVWLGTSAENQEQHDKRVPILMNIPAAVHFVSAEPLLGQVQLNVDFLPDWVIVGGESGPKCRPMKEKWAIVLRDECQSLGVSFFMKQMGGKRKPFPPIPDSLQVREFPCPLQKKAKAPDSPEQGLAAINLK